MTTSLPVVFLYPGQGSQYFGMCRELYEYGGAFRECLDCCSGLAAPYLREPLPKIIYGSRPSQPFRETVSATAAILAVQWSLTQLLMTEGLTPMAVAGYSLGEFVAASVAGMIALDEAFRLALEMAVLLGETCRPGGMIGILGTPDLMEKNPAEFAGCELAAWNAPGHCTIAGPAAGISRAHGFLRSQEILCEKLDVEYAYHSQGIDCLRDAYAARMEGVRLRAPHVPFLSCSKTSSWNGRAAGHFWEVIRQPVRFRQTIESLESQGAYLYLDLGPRGTLANLTKMNLKLGSRSRAVPSITPFGSSGRALERLRLALAS